MLTEKPTAGCARPDRAMGPAGLVARLGVGPLFIYLALFWDGVSWGGALLGLVGLPAIVVAVVALRARRWPEPLSATGPFGHALNLAVIAALFSWHATAGAAFLFYGSSMLVAAVRRAGDCEVTAISNALLDRDDQVGCPLFFPVDALERRAHEGARGGRDPKRTAALSANEHGAWSVAAFTIVGCAAVLLADHAGSVASLGLLIGAAGLCITGALLAPLALRRLRREDRMP